MILDLSSRHNAANAIQQQSYRMDEASLNQSSAVKTSINNGQGYPGSRLRRGKYKTVCTLIL
jgi:hypothetical protein